MKVSGGLSEEAVSKVIQEHVLALEKCYQESDPEGQLVVRLTIGADGIVRAAKVVKGTQNWGTTERCIVGQIEKWHFPPAQDGRETLATISLVASG